MSRTAQELLEDVRQLPPGDLDWFINRLLSDAPASGKAEEEYAVWRKDVGEPEPGYDEWFRAGVEEALSDTSPDTLHEEVVKEIGGILRAARGARRQKVSA